jgi:hypothetical protein
MTKLARCAKIFLRHPERYREADNLFSHKDREGAERASGQRPRKLDALLLEKVRGGERATDEGFGWRSSQQGTLACTVTYS